jgi:hypothetical protein
MVDGSPRSAVRSAYTCIMGQMSDNTICFYTRAATYLIERLGSLLSRYGRIRATCPLHQHVIDLSPRVPSVTNNIHGFYDNLQTLMDIDPHLLAWSDIGGCNTCNSCVMQTPTHATSDSWFWCCSLLLVLSETLVQPDRVLHEAWRIKTLVSNIRLQVSPGSYSSSMTSFLTSRT